MQSDVPKQFMLLNGKPILMHTIESFYYSDFKPEIILVLNVDFITYWEQLCEKYNFLIQIYYQVFFYQKTVIVYVMNALTYNTS